MKTFTTCAEKKAKQFFNLLQGYTKGIRLTAILILLLMGVSNAWGLGYNNESHVYLDVNGTTKYYKVSSEEWSTGCSLPGTWGGELNSQTFNDVQNLTIKGGAVGGWTNSGEKLSATLSYAVTTNTNTPSNWTNFGSVSSNHTTYNGNNAFYYKNDGSADVTPTTPGTYYLHIKISFNSTSKTSYAKFTIPASTYTVAGSKAVLGSEWNQSDTNNDMTLSSGTTYTLTKHDVSLTKGTNYECKVVKDHNWDNAWPSENYSFTVPTTGHYDVTFTFDSSNGNVSVATTRLYAVIYDGNGKTSGTVPATTYHKSGSTITVANNSGNLAKSGHTFEGWNENADGTGTSYAVGSTFSMTSADKNLYAHWTANTYTITWDANDGSDNTTTSEYTYNGDPVNLPEDPTRTGYTFNGWFTEQSGGTQITEIGTTNKPTSNVTYYAQWTEITYTVNISTDGNGSVSPSGDQQIGIEGLEVTAAPNDPSRFRFTKWEVSGGAQVADNYGATTTITATAAGTVIAHFEELQPKTIYLKTVEGTTDGVKWYVKYNDTEYLMDELGCTGEYYRGEVPEETEFQLIAKDNGGNIIAKETRDGLVVPDNSNMLNLVSLAAGGNKIFFKPNEHWKTYKTTNNYFFVARFNTNPAVWKDLTDADGDGTYECEKPANVTEVYFLITKDQASANDWGNNWPDHPAQTDDGCKIIPTDGKNLLTVDSNQEVGGNNDSGTWSEFADTPVNGEGEWTIFEGATYRITFNHEGATSGITTPGVAYVDAQHNSSMPVIELESLPKNTDWKFGGYYTAAVGGTAITNAFGDWLDADGYISNGKWVKEECVTLYAHWVEKTPEITNVTLGKDVFDVGSVETVTATPTVEEHAYSGTYVICWKLLDNSGTVMDLFPFTPGDNNSVSFSVDGLTSGTYTVRASIYASACDTGEELSRYDAKFTIVSGYKVTVKYLCGDDVIKASDIASGHATTPMDITAPEIGGYKFVNWELGDGIFSESDLNSQTISYTAIYDGYLTAKYEKRKLIFLDLSTLPNKDKWTAPHIYLYSSKYWDDSKGTGANTNCVKKGAMQRVPNTENIWYYDYETVNNFNGIVAFTSTNKMTQGNFWDCEVIFREDFTSGTPVFVPASDQEAEIKNDNNSKNAAYYSKGYWVKYMDGTGYWMVIYDAEGNKELVRREFTSETQRMTMTSIVDLEAEHTYKYEIYRNDGYYYKGGDITYTNSSNYKPLNEAEKHTIKTTETGNYTFTLDYFTGDLQIKVQYPGEVGDYRILYTDDVREGRYKPSQIISQNNEEPLVSFFVRPNDNPVLKIQKATLVTEDEVKWDNKVLYLTPHQSWKSDGARFAAYFYNNSGNTWVSMTSINNGEYYGCAIPEGTWTNVIFCRMNPNIQENRWNQDSDGDNKPVWNQTIELTIPTNGNNQFTITNPWDDWHNQKATGNWSKHNNDIIDLSEALNEKLGELDLKNIKANEGSVFNIHLSNNSGTPTIEKVALYTGNYYIRVDAVDGKWYDYKTNPDNLMTYSAFSESEENSFGEKFSHYKTKWCTREKGTMNVKFVIANDYSLCISDTLTQDEGNPFGNIDAHGNINNDGKYDANIRFMWNRHTNRVSRAYVAGASGDNTRFLVLKADQTIQNESGQAINNNEVVFKDTQNWLYERTIKVQPGTLVKLIAYYPDGNKAQYFRGTSANGFEENVSAVQILGGTISEWYTMRIIYDFKTNRLMAAWVPDQNINGELEIDADIMVIRQHQEDATYITFANNDSKLTEVKTVYGVMRFNRWILNNRSTSDHKVLPVQDQKSIYERALYFISFPFDVHLSDVFGFGTYGTHWVISEYNGLRRAQNGYFADNCVNEDCTNWDYIWDPDDFVLEANKGYLLSLDLDLMKHDNEAFWAHDIQQVELFFPSYANVETIAQISYTMPALGDEYECKINYNTNGEKPDSDRRVKDSYWRCIGVPSFADYNSTLTDGTNPITWKPKDTEFPFLYEWNVSDNSLMVRAASQYKFRPTFAYLVQNGNKIHWSAVNATPPPTSIAARQRTDVERNYEWKITLSRDDNQEDQTFLRMTDNEEVSEDFNFNQDLVKELNYGRSDIYTLIGYEKAAANSMPFSENTTVVPLGLDIEQDGDYTIAMPEGVESVGVTLLDAETGERTNLSIGMDYTLSLNKGACHNRLYLEISPIQQTTTDIEYTDQGTREQSVRKVLIDGKLYIVCDGVVYDAQGKRL